MLEIVKKDCCESAGQVSGAIALFLTFFALFVSRQKGLKEKLIKEIKYKCADEKGEIKNEKLKM